MYMSYTQYIPMIVPLGDVIIISATSDCTEKMIISSFVDMFRLAHTRLSPGCSSRVTGFSARPVGTNTLSVHMYFIINPWCTCAARVIPGEVPTASVSYATFYECQGFALHYIPHSRNSSPCAVYSVACISISCACTICIL